MRLRSRLLVVSQFSDPPLRLFTIAGTPIAHDYSLARKFPLVRKFIAFAGPTFAAHDEAFATTGKPSAIKTIVDGMFGGKVLKFVTRRGGRGVHALTVEQDGFVGTVVYVKQRILMVALLETVELGGAMKDLDPEVLASGTQKTDTADGMALKAEQMSIDNEDNTVTDDEETNQSQEIDGDSSEESTTSDCPKIKRLLILEWRAEAMADAMNEDDLKDFVMPKDYF